MAQRKAHRHERFTRFRDLDDPTCLLGVLTPTHKLVRSDRRLSLNCGSHCRFATSGTTGESGMNFLKATITVDLNPLGGVYRPVWPARKQPEEFACRAHGDVARSRHSGLTAQFQPQTY